MTSWARRQSILQFTDLAFSVKSKQGEKKLIDGVTVSAKSGELLAIMGPSGAGKSTLLDLMSGRKTSEQGSVVLNGERITAKAMATISSFVEQEDSLIGVLTVRETITYAARLSMPDEDIKFINNRVEELIKLLGLSSCQQVKIGSAISRGISGGQRRRVSIACSIVTYPRILYLDEPTSGLDATSAKEVMRLVKNLAANESIIVLATIHQPSIEIISFFSKLLLLSSGMTVYCGEVNALASVMEEFGKPVPQFVNPADAVLELVNTDFADTNESSSHARDNSKEDQAVAFRLFCQVHPSNAPALQTTTALEKTESLHLEKNNSRSKLWKHVIILSERSVLNYARNLLAYGIRLGMYCGMGFMLAVIWIHVGTDASRINDRLSVHFFCVAFLAFMSVAGIPSFLEERAVFKKERANGLYGTLPFVLSNSLINIPFLFICTLLFMLIMYFGVGLHPSAPNFFRYLGFLFLALYTAESQVVLVAAILPIFVASLAISAFLNGFWMSVGGYFLKSRSLPRFWYYSFHWMDYQTYAFELLTVSDLQGLTFQCSNGVACPYPSTSLTEVTGNEVITYLGMNGINYGVYTAILIGIIVVYRTALYISLKLSK